MNIPAEVARGGIADVIVAMAEDGLVTDVRRGENRGRTLKHSAVARTLLAVGTLEPQDHTWTKTATIALAPTWKMANLRAIAFIQERRNHHIIGAGSASVDPRGRT